MKIFNWIGFVAVATGAAHLIFAVDGTSSTSAKPTSGRQQEKSKRSTFTGRMSKIWERQIGAPYPYSTHYRPQLASSSSTAVQPSKYPGYDQTDYRATVRPTAVHTYSTYLSPSSADDDEQLDLLDRDGGKKKSYGYGGGQHHNKGYGGGHKGHHPDHHNKGVKGTYYYAQPVYYPHGHNRVGFGFFKPILFVLVLPLFVILFFVAIVAVVRITVASSSSSSAAAAAAQQQQQQQDSNNNNNNNAANNNNNAAAILATSSTSTSTFPFIIIINATGRALEERYNFKWPSLLFDRHFGHHQSSPVADFNDTSSFLLS